MCSHQRVVLHILTVVALERNAFRRMGFYDGSVMYKSSSGDVVFHALIVGGKLEICFDVSGSANVCFPGIDAGA